MRYFIVKYCGSNSYLFGRWHEFNCFLEEYFKPIIIYSLLVIFIFLLLKFLFKDSKNSRKKTLLDKRRIFLQDYVTWHNKYKNKLVSLPDCYESNKFFIIKDKSGNILEEVSLQTARYRILGNYFELNDLLNEYIRFHNKKNRRQADLVSSIVRDDNFLLFTSNNEFIKTISIKKSFNELNYNKSLEEFQRKKRERFN